MLSRNHSRGPSRDGIGREISSRAGSTEDFFGATVPGQVATKTTVQVQSQRVFPESEEDINLHDIRTGKVMYKAASKEDLESWSNKSRETR